MNAGEGGRNICKKKRKVRKDWKWGKKRKNGNKSEGSREMGMR